MIFNGMLPLNTELTTLPNETKAHEEKILLNAAIYFHISI